MWDTVTKPGIWVVLRTTVSHEVCRHQMCILYSSFCKFVLIDYNNKGKYSEFYMGYSDDTGYVGRRALKYYPCVHI